MSREHLQGDFRSYLQLHLCPFICPLRQPPTTRKVHAGPVVPSAPTDQQWNTVPGLCRMSKHHLKVVLKTCRCMSAWQALRWTQGCLLSSSVPRASPGRRMGTEGGRTVIRCQTYPPLEYCQKEIGGKICTEVFSMKQTEIVSPEFPCSQHKRSSSSFCLGH